MELPREPQTVTVDKAEAQPNWVHIGFFVLALATVLGVIWILSGPLSVNVPDDKDLTIKNVEDLRNYFWSLGMVVAGIVAIWGLLFAAVRTVALDRQARVAVQESRLNEQKHASEAFATAIEQLGHDNFAVRLGAVYALEALAKSSQDLHGPIFETLCAYIREQAPIPDDIDEQDAALADKIKNRKDGQTIRKIITDHLQTALKPDLVVQAILTVIGRRDPDRDPYNAGGALDFRLDLRETDLRKADMTGGHFENALFIGARLDGANLTRSHLDGANLNKARLKDTNLWGAHLDGAILANAHLDGAHLFQAHLNGASLTGTRLDGADLLNAHLNNAYLWHVSFDGETTVSRADFTKAINIPAKPNHDFRATVKNADSATWPADDDPDAWDRGEDGEEE